MRVTPPTELDVLVVGAGFSGLYSLHRLRTLGRSVHLVEADDDLGGVWYRNRYPGARCDIESVDYCYSFDDSIVREWTWAERYPAQPEILRYINFVADRLDLRSGISFDTRVDAMHWDAEDSVWLVATDCGDRIRARHVIMASGQLSKPQFPDIEGIKDFSGELLHTGDWPRDGVELTGKRVGVIGTGSSGVQTIPQVAKQAAHTTVLQRTAHYAIPARNHDLDPAYVEDLKSRFQDYREIARHHPGGTHRRIGTESALDVDPGALEETFRGHWEKGGPDILAAYRDFRTDERAAEKAGDFVKERIREIVKDPETAEKLCPKGYPFGAKRLVLEIDYYTTFNRDNVSLVDVKADPIDRVDGSAVVLESGARHELDVLITATGFDALTGPLFAIDIVGVDGQRLPDAWKDGPRTFLGIGTHGFPNLYVVAGAGSPSVLSNVLISIEQHVEWITDFIDHQFRTGIISAEVDEDAQDRWTQEVYDVAAPTLFMKGNSWYLGANVPGKPRVFSLYLGGVGHYRDICDKVAADDYAGFTLTRGEIKS
ncbi:flavin-containing monooxygenase [Nocardioides alcanivorans]|uniref:flavin-containing monooxygenase n=1 Tax=Nocardioides alcanivorans TaxID=2897352 RepID=UPI001F3EF12D|nr:NAD(P)/FAD-dependent oxidoreductase [Nocardioides alcanivorans]